MKTKADSTAQFVYDLEAWIKELKTTRTEELLEQLDCLRKQLEVDKKDKSPIEREQTIYHRIPIGLHFASVAGGSTQEMPRYPQVCCRPTHMMFDQSAEHFQLMRYSIGNYLAQISVDPIPLAPYAVLEYRIFEHIETMTRVDSPIWCEPGMPISLAVHNRDYAARHLSGVLLCDVKPPSERY